MYLSLFQEGTNLSNWLICHKALTMYINCTCLATHIFLRNYTIYFGIHEFKALENVNLYQKHKKVRS